MGNIKRPLKESAEREQIVGVLRQDIIDLLNITLPNTCIYMNPGAIKHIRNKHSEIFEKYFQKIPEIISEPDYVGVNPTEPDSVELVKNLDDNILIAIKLDPSGYLYFSSMYELKSCKFINRVNSGRLKKL